MDTALVVLAKAPETAKARLAAAIGRAAATRVAAALLDDALARGETGAFAPRFLDWDGPADHPVPVRAGRGDWTCRSQAAGNLGRRMERALAAALEHAPRALLMGTDCPDLGGPALASAARHLDSADLVLVPAVDGGYALIGAGRGARPHLHDLFAGMAWGGSGVAAATRERARRGGFVVAETETLRDLDDAADLAALAGRHPFLAAAQRY